MLSFVSGMEVELILECWSNWIEFSGGVEICFIFVADWICLRYSVGIEINLFFGRGVEIDCVKAEIDLLLVWWSIRLVFLWVVEIDLMSV